jgi:NAD(P)H-flavin reductase
MAVPERALWPRPHRVVQVERETADVVTLALEPVDPVRDAGTGFRPGQFHMLYVFGSGEVPISISGDPDGGPILHTIRDVGAVTRALCAVEPGAIVGVRGPFGTPWPLDDARGGDVVFVGGGIGLAPLRSAIHAVIARRREYGRVAVVVGARTPEDLVFRAELDAWARDVTVEVTVDRAGPSWRGHVGVVTKLLPRIAFEADDAHAFLCGPEIMMRFSVQELLAAGVPDGAIHVSLERNMKCAVGVCGHCQLGSELLCASGPVYAYPRIAKLWTVQEL